MNGTTLFSLITKKTWYLTSITGKSVAQNGTYMYCQSLFHVGTYNAVIMPCTKEESAWLTKVAMKSDWRTDLPKP